MDDCKQMFKSSSVYSQRMCKFGEASKMIGCSFKDRGGVTGVRSLGSCVLSVSLPLSLHSKCSSLVLPSHPDCLFSTECLSFKAEAEMWGFRIRVELNMRQSHRGANTG